MSLRAAINAKCRDCTVDELAAGSAAVQIELCACYDCPLWPVRRVRPEHVRMPYSGPVCEEQGLTEAMAAFRLANPYVPPPEALYRPESDGYRDDAGESGESEPAEGGST